MFLLSRPTNSEDIQVNINEEIKATNDKVLLSTTDQITVLFEPPIKTISILYIII